MDFPTLDVASALRRLNGDRELYGELVEIFREDTPVLFREASTSRDRGALITGIHRLQGVAASIGAMRAVAHASAIVELARQGQEAAARQRLPGLQQELDQVETALAARPWTLASVAPA